MCTRVLGSSIRPRSTYEYITLYTRPATWMAENVNPHKYLLWKGKGKGSCRALISISFATFVVIIMVFKPFMTTKHVYILLDLCVSSKFFSFFLKWKNFIQVFFDWNSNFVWSLSRRRDVYLTRLPIWGSLIELTYFPMKANVAIPRWYFEVLNRYYFAIFEALLLSWPTFALL